MKMILPNGCAHSELSVKPNDWHTKKAKVTTNWFIKYRFYDPNKPLPKQIMIKGMNSFKTLKERQAETKRLLNHEMEIVSNNYIRDIKKRKTTKYLRQVLTPDERVLVNGYLESQYPSFHRFLHIFFHSGARIAEIMRMKVKDIDLPNQRYKVIIKKGGNYHEVWKTIKTIALPYWIEQLKIATPNDFVFSKGLECGKGKKTKKYLRLLKQSLHFQ
jgi:integrase